MSAQLWRLAGAFGLGVIAGIVALVAFVCGSEARGRYR